MTSTASVSGLAPGSQWQRFCSLLWHDASLGFWLDVSRMAIDQALIDQFVALSGEDSWIHTDPERAAKSKFGGTIAPGKIANVFAVVSFTDELAAEAGIEPRQILDQGCTSGRSTRAIKRVNRSVAAFDSVGRLSIQRLTAWLLSGNTAETSHTPVPATLATLTEPGRAAAAVRRITSQHRPGRSVDRRS